MAKEVISQILSPDNAPSINGVNATVKFSSAYLTALHQGLVEKQGYGINDNLIQNASDAAQIVVTRVKPVKSKAREQGSSKNGASFSANQHYSQTESVNVDVLTVMDDPIIIPRARQDTIPVDLLSTEIEQSAGRFATICNGITTASKLFRVYDDKANGKEVYETLVTAEDETNGNVNHKFEIANSLLDEGDEEHGIDVFPTSDRIAVFKASYRATLKAKALLTLGGSNYAYEIAKMSGLNAEALKIEDGYMGILDGAPCHIISNESLRNASAFLGLPENELKKSPFVGYISSGLANARGIVEVGATKIVDATAGQGVIFQPFYKVGCMSWWAKGTSLLNKEEYNPLGELQSLVGKDGITYRVKAEGSRLTPEIPAENSVSWTLNAANFTLSDVHAYDDWNVDHVAKAYFYVGNESATSVHDFCVKAKASNFKGTFEIGVQKATTINNGQYLNVLVISDDGTVSIASKKRA